MVLSPCFDKLDSLTESRLFDMVDSYQDFVLDLTVSTVVSGLESASSSDFEDTIVHLTGRGGVCNDEFVLDVFHSFHVGWTSIGGGYAYEFDLDVLDSLVTLLVVNSEFKTNFLSDIILSA